MPIDSVFVFMEISDSFIINFSSSLSSLGVPLPLLPHRFSSLILSSFFFLFANIHNFFPFTYDDSYSHCLYHHQTILVKITQPTLMLRSHFSDHIQPVEFNTSCFISKFPPNLAFITALLHSS